MTTPHGQPSLPDLDSLVSEFHPSADSLGVARCVDAAEIPATYGQLLNHDKHMTVTVEAYHDQPVDVRVLQVKQTNDHYVREVLLTRRSDAAVVQYGIVRLNFSYLDAEVQQEIRAQQAPLGRILIQHNVLRQVELTGLWSFQPSETLSRHFGSAQQTYGRTAMIHCNTEPAIELLELVPPISS